MLSPKQKILLACLWWALFCLARTHAQNLSLNFDGNDDDVFVDLSTGPFVNDPAANFTLELWFRTTDAGGPIGPSPDGLRTLVTLSGFLPGFVEIGEYNGRLTLVEAFGPPVVTDLGATTRNAWQHLRVDYSAGAWTFILDCAVAHTSVNPLPFGLSIIQLGEFIPTVNSPRHWLGQMDEFRLWNGVRPFTPGSCPDAYCSPAGNEPDLLVYYNFDQGVGGGNNAPLTTIPDQTANGYDGAAANFTGNGLQSNLVPLGFPGVFPVLHGLELTIRDYPYQNDTLTEICDGDPAHFTLDLDGAVPGPFSNVSVDWEYSDNGSPIWLPLTSPPFTDFRFPILPGVITASCGSSPTGITDRRFRAVATVTDPASGRVCTYRSTEQALRICCPVSGIGVSLIPNAPLCEGDTASLTVSLTGPPWVMTPGPATTIDWTVTDHTGTQPLPAQSGQSSFNYVYIPPPLTAPLDLIFTVTVTNCGTKTATAQASQRFDPEPECGLIDALPLGAPQNLTLVGTVPHPTYEICPGNDAVVGIDPAFPFSGCVPQWQYSFDTLSWANLGRSNSVQNTNVLPSHLWPTGADRIYYRIQCDPLSSPSGCDPCFSNLIEIRLPARPVAATISGPTKACLADALFSPIPLTVTGGGVPGQTYRWFHNGLFIGTGLSQNVSEAGCYWLETVTECYVAVGNQHCLELCENVAVLSCPLAPNECARLGDPVTLSACDSYYSCDPSVGLNYTWYLDGVLQTGQTGCLFTFTPSAGGQIVRVEVVDQDLGCAAASAERRVVPCSF